MAGVVSNCACSWTGSGGGCSDRNGIKATIWLSNELALPGATGIRRGLEGARDGWGLRRGTMFASLKWFSGVSVGRGLGLYKSNAGMCVFVTLPVAAW